MIKNMSKTAHPQKFGDLPPSKFPGERLGLKEHGSGSIARLGRRILAICVDWALAMLLGKFITPSLDAESLVTLLVFLVTQSIFISTAGGSCGHLLFGLRIVALNGKWVGVWRPLVRSLLLAIVIPVLVWDSDHRGFHDKIPGTVLIKI
ncbi:RDD family protein [Canibacter zhuwentaonis]|uniref:RDD family protein n=1 Tax=Canibacter zhuwentaonis TaxID=2837491 RepID=UPI0020289E77|nr:RDD family protein [Canibacter zhuwentaonis]